MTPSLTDHERECLQHALGLNRNRVPYRNYFNAEPGSPDDVVFVELQRRGLARLVRGPLGIAPDNLWRVTEAGARAAGADAEHARRIAA
ncbi:MAG: hypothetical protein DI527_18145 [Chelatococcus sp.]|nr:MAG: hypothetical protein DI527_18145 [Chelatococcus sp.]